MFVTTRIASPSITQRCVSCGEHVPNMLSTISFSKDIRISTGVINQKSDFIANPQGWGPSRQQVTTTYSYKNRSFTAVFPICDACVPAEEDIARVEKDA